MRGRSRWKCFCIILLRFFFCISLLPFISLSTIDIAFSSFLHRDMRRLKRAQIQLSLASHVWMYSFVSSNIDGYCVRMSRENTIQYFGRNNNALITFDYAEPLMVRFDSSRRDRFARLLTDNETAGTLIFVEVRA